MWPEDRYIAWAENEWEKLLTAHPEIGCKEFEEIKAVLRDTGLIDLEAAYIIWRVRKTRAALNPWSRKLIIYQLREGNNLLKEALDERD